MLLRILAQMRSYMCMRKVSLSTGMAMDSLYGCRVQSELPGISGWVELTLCEWLRCFDILIIDP